MMKKLFLPLFLFCATVLHAQNTPQVKASFSADSVMIGDQFKLDVEVTKDVVQVTEFPTFDGKLTEYIEILKETPVDTMERNGRTVKLKKEYTLTSFQEGFHTMGHFPMLYMDKNITDTIFSRDSLMVQVTTLPVDTATQTIYDIKRPLEAPLKFGEISGYLLIGLIVLAAIAFAVYYIVKRMKNSPLLERKTTIEPPHVIAIRKLEKLHNKRLWQGGKQKLYYTALTDILREYLCNRYGVKAMEMTSVEIKDAISPILSGTKTMEDLSEILGTADFVKFAKYTPSAEQNEDMYNKAYYFVENTREQEKAISDETTSTDTVGTAEEKPQAKISEQKSDNSDRKEEMQ